jgi:3-deoxy-D-manno-octulosonate 8-phosphate phosphatase KdsC-like HAD superfamily phosphatase
MVGADEGAQMSTRDAKRCRDRAEELRVTSVLMTADDRRRVRRELAVEYEAVAEQWEAINVLTALQGTK